MEEECQGLWKKGETDYRCDLTEEPCVMYNGDYLNGHKCEHYEGVKDGSSS